MRTIEQIKESILQESPVPCNFKVGDKVTFTNDYGVSFNGRHIIGFEEKGKESYGRTIYLDGDSYWFPVKPESLKKED